MLAISAAHEVEMVGKWKWRREHFVALLIEGMGIVLLFMAMFIREDVTNGGRLPLTPFTDTLLDMVMMLAVVTIVFGVLAFYRREIKFLLGLDKME